MGHGIGSSHCRSKAAVELLHNATLIHDDYVDESTHRRGRPTVAAAEGPERAIAVGDYYFAKATRLIAEMGNPAVTSALAEALEAICASQIDDVALRGAYPGDRESYLRVVRGKTGTLSKVHGLAGTIATRDGSVLAYAFLVNDPKNDYNATVWLQRVTAAISTCGCR